MNDVVAEEQGDVQSRLFDGDALESEDPYGLLLAGGVMPLKRK